MKNLPSVLLSVLMILALALYFGLAVLGWGNLTGFFAHPARAGLVVATLLLSVPTLLSGMNLSTGRREDARNRWIFLPLTLLSLAFGYLPPYLDKRDLLTLDGDSTRYLGLALYVVGGGLRVWAIVALGKRFSGLVAIQENHALKTDGVYASVRHPSYTGAILALAGWTLVFRSAIVLLLVPLLIWIVISRIDAEEALLETQFGQEYVAYQGRTKRLLPFVY